MLLIEHLPVMKTPGWLEKTTLDRILDGPFPFREILQDSLYYPACGYDGDPVRYLAGNIYSFVYADYSISRQELLDDLENSGFRGYTMMGLRSINYKELVPDGWQVTRPRSVDGDPSKYRDWWKPPHCLWAIFERREEFPPSHGPSRFSFLFLCADGAAAYQALYCSNGLTPKAIAIIQPGHGMGGNWTNFEDPTLILGRSVLQSSHGIPEILLFGGFCGRNHYKKPCWPGYGKLLCKLHKRGGGVIGVWSRE